MLSRLVPIKDSADAKYSLLQSEVLHKARRVAT